MKNKTHTLTERKLASRVPKSVKKVLQTHTHTHKKGRNNTGKTIRIWLFEPVDNYFI